MTAVDDVVTLVFMRPVEGAAGMTAYGRATIINGNWVDVPTDEVLRKLTGQSSALHDVDVELVIRTQMKGGLHRGTRTLGTLRAAVEDTLRAHGAHQNGLTDAVLQAVAQSVAFTPAEPEPEPEREIYSGDMVGYRGLTWNVNKVRARKRTVDLHRGHGKRQETAEKISINDLQWVRPMGDDSARR